MNNALKMARLDVLTMKAHTLSFLVAFVIVALFMFSSLMMMGISCAWIVALLSTMVFMAQEKNDLNRLYGSLALLKKDIVLGRFLYTIAFFLLVFVFAAILDTIVAFISGVPLRAYNYAQGFAIGFLAFSLIVGGQMPFYFKLGYMKGRALSLIILLAIMGLFALASFLIGYENVMMFLSSQSVVFVLALMALSLVVLGISYKASVAVYQRG